VLVGIVSSCSGKKLKGRRNGKECVGDWRCGIYWKGSCS